jgi:hypothetical protein
MQHSQLIQRRCDGWPVRGLFALLATIGAALTLAVLPAAALAASPPKVQIEPAEQTPTGFILKAKVNPENSSTTYYFIYKQAGAIECEDLEGCGPETPHGGPLTGDTQQEVQAEVTGLTPGTTYVYWLIARNASPEAVRSRELTFTTPPAGTAPVIDSVSLSSLTSTDATLEAQIDTEGLATTYAFHMWSSCAHQRCEYIRKIPLPSGLLLGSFQDQTVSLDLNSAGLTLNYGAEYGWGITATSEAGHTSVSGGVFEPPPPSIIEPLSTTTSPLSGAGQPAGSDTNSGDRPAGSAASSSSSTPDVQSPGIGLGKTTKLEPFENAQKLSKALKLCERKPKNQRPSCKRQAEKKYAPTNRHQA